MIVAPYETIQSEGRSQAGWVVSRSLKLSVHWVKRKVTILMGCTGCGAGKPVIYANHSGEETPKGHLTRLNLGKPSAFFTKFATDSLIHVG
jgi:hypothetical protein